MTTLYVVDRRSQYELPYAVNAVNGAPDLPSALAKAKEWAKLSGQAYYVHELGPVAKRWQPVAKVKP